ncbi:universal stress protein [uncultured Cellulomonas sp.]|uniref:universal stress protein n=1 Tax=uncultured Cellulomonas sp. TaxID=189682 RepID=UPI00261A3FFF|nr:universal stress protein [uncultured Cellulomonas sp.]
MNAEGPVVIAVDGSPHSDQTLEWGLQEAELRGAPVVLARAYQEPREYTQWSWYPILDDLHFDTEAKNYLDSTLEQVRERRPGLQVTSQLLHGAEVPMLRTLSEDARLLVVGARGRAGRSRIGRVSAHLAAHAHCSVAVVRDTGHTSGPVVVGVDGSPSSVAAGRVAAREARLRGTTLVVVHARPAPTTYGPSGLVYVSSLGAPGEEDPTARAAHDVLADLTTEHPDLHTRLDLRDEDAVHALLRTSADAALLVVGSRGLGAFTGMLLGSVSNEVVRAAATTVLVVHDEPAR